MICLVYIVYFSVFTVAAYMANKVVYIKYVRKKIQFSLLAMWVTLLLET